MGKTEPAPAVIGFDDSSESAPPAFIVFDESKRKAPAAFYGALFKWAINQRG
ncbi:MAG: hypothetical protein IKS45_06730 [Thermoguttaceae bacterium]|nr:hypothetical protein [Thermoguttaceae bacterium]